MLTGDGGKGCHDFSQPLPSTSCSFSSKSHVKWKLDCALTVQRFSCPHPSTILHPESSIQPPFFPLPWLLARMPNAYWKFAISMALESLATSSGKFAEASQVIKLDHIWNIYDKSSCQTARPEIALPSRFKSKSWAHIFSYLYKASLRQKNNCQIKTKNWFLELLKSI